MTRPLRIEFPGAWYHVRQQGRTGPLFPGVGDYRFFLGLLREAISRGQLRLVAYCLLPREYHLVLQTGRLSLSRCMRQLNGAHALRRQQKDGTSGAVFQGRYKAALLNPRTHLVQVTRHVHRLPLELGLRGGLLYSWSSCRACLDPDQAPDWLDVKVVTGRFPGTGADQLLACRRFMREQDSPEFKALYAGGRMPRFLGDASFAAGCRKRAARAARERERESPGPAPARLAQAVGAVFDVPADELLDSRKGRSNPARNVYIYLLRTELGLSMLDIAELLGLRGHSGVSSAVRRLEQRRRKDETLRRQLGAVLARLAARESPQGGESGEAF